MRKHTSISLLLVFLLAFLGIGTIAVPILPKDSIDVLLDEPLPIIMIHGLFSSPDTFTKLIDQIHKKHPNLPCYALSYYDGVSTIITGMMDQVPVALKAFQEAANNITGPYNVVSHSQGSLIARAVIEEFDHHRVNHWVSVAGPNAGEFGVPGPSYINYIFPSFERKEVFHIWYASPAQNHVSFAGYWNDPYEYDSYVEEVDFLPMYNNQKNGTKDSARYKRNFLKMKKVTLLGSPADDIIKPWDSSLFNFYSENDATKVTDMTEHELYKQDLFGLRSLDERGDLVRVPVDNIPHTSWTDSDEGIATIIKYLNY